METTAVVRMPQVAELVEDDIISQKGRYPHKADVEVYIAFA